MKPFKLGFITDEYSQDLDEVIKFALEVGAEHLEIRSVWNKNVKDLTDEDLRVIRRLASQNGLQIYCLASPLFKEPIETYEAHMAMLDRLCDIAQMLDAKYIRCFAFVGSTDLYEKMKVEIADKLKAAAEVADESGLKLVLENEPICIVTTGRQQGDLIRLVGHRALLATWDPGNAYVSGVEKPYPDDYTYVRGLVGHMHVKDAVREDGKARIVKVGSGNIDYKGQFKALYEDGFRGTISLETHYRHPTGGRMEATRESFIALKNIVREALGLEE
ncbi:MAG: sugar phosphate isomerase/epimerase family protein [Candidatus Bathyarchaeia archaeon]|nr:sugar phosphate isomerase/epimerase [Candidatus Bathyarchaeota archaeon]